MKDEKEKKNKKLTEKETEKVAGGGWGEELEEGRIAYQNSHSGDCDVAVLF